MGWCHLSSWIREVSILGVGSLFRGLILISVEPPYCWTEVGQNGGVYPYGSWDEGLGTVLAIWVPN